jgi:outer membrane lipoprotein-sorting protein
MAAATLMAVSQANPSIRDFVEGDLKDFSFVTKKVSANQRELAKINRDFGQAYRFDSTTLQYKEPLMLRGESRVEDQSIVYILNGPIRRYRIPRAGINTREDLSKAPGKRQSPLDFGILTPSLFSSLFEAKFVRKDTRTGAMVYDLTYQDRFNDDTRHRVWVDPVRKLTIRREWYSQLDNYRLMATFYYEEPKQFGPVWVPTRLTVRNAEDKVAGVSEYTKIRVNTGLEDSLFNVK